MWLCLAEMEKKGTQRGTGDDVREGGEKKKRRKKLL